MQRCNFNDPKVADSMRFRILSSIKASGGRLAVVAKQMGVNRVTMWRWVERLGLTEELGAIRAQNRTPVKEKGLVWHIRNDPERGREMMRDIIWRNDGIVEACAVEMRCSRRMAYYRIGKLGLLGFVHSARSAARQKRLLGKSAPLAYHPAPSPHLETRSTPDPPQPPLP